MKNPTDVKRLKRALRKQQVKTALQISKQLGVRRQKSILFPAVAAALGKPWPESAGPGYGYALVMEYAEKVGIRAPAVRIKTSSPQPHQRTSQPRPSPSPKPQLSASEVAAVLAPEFLLSFEWRRLRMQVIKARGARCECCGATPADGSTVINVDHIKPRKYFPELALVKSNLQVLCDKCNHGKGNWDQTDWRMA
jgi:hypothetical protein